ncbi:MAG: hypothetical protein WCD35_04475 [Mycobacteriales bacterium]
MRPVPLRDHARSEPDGDLRIPEERLLPMAAAVWLAILLMGLVLLF